LLESEFATLPRLQGWIHDIAITVWQTNLMPTLVHVYLSQKVVHISLDTALLFCAQHLLVLAIATRSKR
jgi:hypothetical protein